MKERGKTTSGSLFHSPFTSLQKAFDQMAHNFYSLLSRSISSEEWKNFHITPAVDVVEDKDNYKIEAEMPGMGIDDIKVYIDPGVLTIKGEKTISRKDEGKDYTEREISYGNYFRSIPLPDNLKTDQAKASFKKGMLWVTIPKKPAQIMRQQNELKIEQVEK